MLVRRTSVRPRRDASAGPAVDRSTELDRRSFLRRSGLAAGALAALGTLSLQGLRKAEAGAPPVPGSPVQRHKSI
jgi:formate dehydrogenase major subunit